MSGKARRISAGVLFRQGAAAADRPERAIPFFERALACDPALACAFNDLGNARRAMGQEEAAAAAYRWAVRLDPGQGFGHYNLAGALARLGRTGLAESEFRCAAALRPDHAATYNNHANLRLGQGELPGAARAYLRAVALRPDWDDAHENLAGALEQLHDAAPGAAAGLAERWRSMHSGNAVARHIGAALAGATDLARADDAYVRQVFDHFAPDFDATLAALAYRAPQLVASLLGGGPDRLDTLDAGCGTGLCGGFLRPLSRRLTGVDLSSGMLERAAARGIYDALERAELVAYLADRPATFDLIVAADVLCYFGRLEPVLAAAARALRTNGRVAFTVEWSGEDGPDVRLLPNGRFSHGAGYVSTCLEQAGFQRSRHVRACLRREAGAEVPGLLVLAGRTTLGE